jgi:hypothetical protein
MASEVGSAVIGALAGAVGGGAVSYFVGRLQAPAELRKAMIEKQMHDRWDDAKRLRYLLGEISHSRGHVLDGDMGYIEDGRDFRQQAREQARESIPLLGQNVTDAVIELTDEYEEFFRRAEAGENCDDLSEPIGQNHLKASRAIDEALRSLPSI